MALAAACETPLDRPADSSPSQERLMRIAAMLREAEQAVPVLVTARRPRRAGVRDAA